MLYLHNINISLQPFRNLKAGLYKIDENQYFEIAQVRTMLVKDITARQDRQCPYNVKLRRVRVAIFAVENR